MKFTHCISFCANYTTFVKVDKMLMFNQEYFTPGRKILHRYEHDLAPMMATQLQRKLAVTASTSIHSSVKLSPSTLSVWCRSLWEMVIITGADYSEK